MAKKISVYNIKGGVGKTFITGEMCSALADEGYKVLAIDLDPQKDLTRFAKINSYDNIDKVLSGECELKDAVKHTETFDIISGATSLTNANRKYGDDRDDIFLLADMCEALDKFYDFILFDCHPGRDIITDMMYVASDYIITPALEDDNSIMAVDVLYSELEKLRKSRGKESHAKLICIVLNRYRNSTNVHKRALNTLINYSEGIEDFPAVLTVRESVKAAEAWSQGSSLQDYEKYNNVSVDVRRIIKVVEGLNNG